MSALDVAPSQQVRLSGPWPRRQLEGLTRRIAIGADLLVASRRLDIARMVICWADLKRG